MGLSAEGSYKRRGGKKDRQGYSVPTAADMLAVGELIISSPCTHNCILANKVSWGVGIGGWLPG